MVHASLPSAARRGEGARRTRRAARRPQPTVIRAEERDEESASAKKRSIAGAVERKNMK